MAASSITRITHVLPFQIEQDGGRTLVRGFTAWDYLKIKKINIFIKSLSSSSGGTYTLDVMKNGVSILSSALNLETATPNSWFTINMTDDEAAPGDNMLIVVASDNADLTGGTGTLVQVELIA